MINLINNQDLNLEQRRNIIKPVIISLVNIQLNQQLIITNMW